MYSKPVTHTWTRRFRSGAVSPSDAGGFADSHHGFVHSTHARTAPLRESVMCVRALPLKRSGAAHRSYSTPTHQPSPISQCGCPNLKPLTLKPLKLKPLGVEYRNTHAFTCIQLRARMKYKYMYSKLPCAYSGTRLRGLPARPGRAANSSLSPVSQL